jgi:hypothetical protein
MKCQIQLLYEFVALCRKLCIFWGKDWNIVENPEC